MVTEDEDDTEMTAAPPETGTTDAPAQPQDHWDVEEDGITWHRIHVVPRQALIYIYIYRFTDRRQPSTT